MVETMRLEGHKALVHTAAASNLGQMLNKICLKDGVGLVNIVRSPQQEDMLRRIGAEARVRFRCAEFHGGPDRGAGRDRRDPRLRRHRRRQAGRQILTAHGGGRQQDRQGLQPLRIDHLQAGLYLRRPRHRPDRIQPGLRHGLGHRRLAAVPVPAKDRPAEAQKLRERVVAELKTTFASHYTQVISLQEALQFENIAAYGKRATGEKYLINPNKAG